MFWDILYSNLYKGIMLHKTKIVIKNINQILNNKTFYSMLNITIITLAACFTQTSIS